MIETGHSLHSAWAGHGLVGFHASFTSLSLALTSPATKFVDGVEVVIFTILKQKFYCLVSHFSPHPSVQNYLKVDKVAEAQIVRNCKYYNP